jgi:tRNA U34 2-thiouridine synthase MnmA/TrmU
MLPFFTHPSKEQLSHCRFQTGQMELPIVPAGAAQLLSLNEEMKETQQIHFFVKYPQFFKESCKTLEIFLQGKSINYII